MMLVLMRNSTRFLLGLDSINLSILAYDSMRHHDTFLNGFLINYGRLMNVVTQILEQHKALEQDVLQALELAHAGSDAAEVAVTKSTGINVNTRFGGVENKAALPLPI